MTALIEFYVTTGLLCLLVVAAVDYRVGARPMTLREMALEIVLWPVFLYWDIRDVMQR